ncbi:hypothetical protein EBB79_19705 [Parasedimentitalea marina]|uniref:Uncharacterized protein n=2 Tax=Parasedimentitalea marina TaxID=2483033 RepID=A0A3T0N7C0_9RHOB|nr:hypothetical protein EBB79_19705 [Parasedimentitalea marina]
MGLGLGMLFTTGAQAADFSPGGDPSMDCLLQMTGVIETGDTEKLNVALKTVLNSPPSAINGKSYNSIVNDGDPARICLDSPGGSLSEALKMADLLYSYDAVHGWSQETGWISKLGTAVPANAACESACAVFFLSGGIDTESDAGRMPNRVLHAKGRLGFHSASLEVPDGNYNADSVNKAFKVALQSMSQLTDRQTVLRLRPSLLARILATPPDQMHYLETVGEAVEWNIEIAGLPRLKEASRKNVAIACNHMQRRHAAQDGSAFPGFYHHDVGLGRWTEEYSQIWSMESAFESFKATEYGLEFTSINAMGSTILCEGSYSFETQNGVMKSENTQAWYGSAENHWLFPSSIRFKELLSLGGSDTVIAPDVLIRDRKTIGANRCLVFSKETKLDDDPCQLETHEKISAGLGQDGMVLRFIWPSGAVTVVETQNQTTSSDPSLQINGTTAYGEYPGNFGLDVSQFKCIMNPATERVFCYQT